MTRRAKDEEREERINMEIVVMPMALKNPRVAQRANTK